MQALTKPTIAVIGAGPGGLTTAMLLAHQGYHVHVFEKEAEVGGRNAPLQLGDYTFDTGPTFLMMDFVLRKAFAEAGRDPDRLLDFKRLDPMYQLHFKNFNLQMTSDHDKMEKDLERVFPGSGPGFRRFIQNEKKRFEMLMPCLQKSYGKLSDYLSLDLLKAVPWLGAGRSMFEELGRYFESDDLRLAFTFQSKYLGMSPWECPALFTMIPYVEHGLGIFHVTGGLNKISRTMRDVAVEDGAIFHMNSTVNRVRTGNGTATGIELEDGTVFACDSVVVNADFGWAANHLFAPGAIRKYTPERVNKMDYSCSTFMLYLGLDTVLDLPHHSIWFSEDYHGNIQDIFHNKRLNDHPSFYLQNASVTDPTLAPPGHSTLYVLMPVANNQANLDWEKEGSVWREKLLDRIQERTGIVNLRKHIMVEKVITPQNWENDYHVHFGATFNLAHKFKQLLGFRPHNQFEDFSNVYLVGGGTHPGSGLPTIYDSARISSALLRKNHPLPS